MTALKPLETHNVVGMKAGKYQPNKKCAQPECGEDATDNHHVFPRSFITNSLWFVSIDGEDPIPHVSGLCHTHHMDVEDHRAWIKLEDGEFVWYDREPAPYGQSGVPDFTWKALGPLNPQPGNREGKPKRKRFTGEARKKRKVLSIKVPDDEQEDGAALWDEVIDIGRELLVKTGLIGEDQRESYPVYHTIMAVANKGLEALREESEDG